jgi:hypothetical protein
MTRFYTLDEWETRPIDDRSKAQNVEQNSFFLAIHPILMIRGLTNRTRRATEVTSKGFLDDDDGSSSWVPFNAGFLDPVVLGF